jgi:NADH-quinone oxidoreductase subunit N
MNEQLGWLAAKLPADYPFPDLMAMAPEIVLAVGAMLLLLLGVFREKKSTPAVAWAGVILLALVGLLVLYPAAEKSIAFGGSFVVDRFASFVKLVLLIGSALAIVMSLRFIRAERIERFEFPLLILFATLGMMIMVSANDLVTLYLGVELQSLPIYVLAAFNRDSLRSSEAGLKYFVLGALSSGLLLYGASLVYGFTGTTSFALINEVLQGEGAKIGLTFGLVFLAASLAFKVSAVPFHMWTPDVYEGAPTPVTAFMGLAPKAAALALFARVMIGAFGPVTVQWQQILVFISVASMVLGAFAAIGQSNVKRLMAYSTIGHMGYALAALAAGTPQGVQGLLIYIAIYIPMTAGTFVCILSMRRSEGMVESIEDLAGLSRNQPLMAAALAVFMFSLAGVPPLAGFFGKWYVFTAAIQANLYWLAIIGVLSSVVAAYYYLRIVKVMYFDEPAQPFERPIGRSMALILTGSALFIVFFGVYPGPLIASAETAASALFH